MNDDKVSVKEALDKLYDLSWMIGSTAMEYLTDKDGEKIRDYIGVIEDRINDLEGELSEFKKYFEPYDIDEETAEAITRSKCPKPEHWECCIGKWRAKIVILLRIAIQQVSLFEKLLAV